MNIYSLRLRLLAGGAITIFVALGFAWLVLTMLFQRHIERQFERELTKTASNLVAGLQVDGSSSLKIQQKPADPRYEESASGLYWQITMVKGTLRSASLKDQVLAGPAPHNPQQWQFGRADGPFGQRVFLLQRVIQPEGMTGPVLVQFARAEDKLRRARDVFSLELGLFLFVLAILLSCAAWGQVHLGLQPLARLPGALTALRGNASARLGANYPCEVAPLTRAINDLAEAREADLKRARERAADLAHALKSPLAALAAQSQRVEEGKEDPKLIAAGLNRAIAAAAAAVESELARTRAATSRHSPRDKRTAPLAAFQSLLAILEATDKGMRLDVVVNCSPHLSVPVAEEDLTEILGPLLDNAVRYARREVRVRGEAAESEIHLFVEDDGPGILARDAAKAMMRGQRLDEAGLGHGLGLSIARDLVEATGGNISLGVSALGGLEVKLVWRQSSLTALESSRRDAVRVREDATRVAPQGMHRAPSFGWKFRI